MPKHRRHTPPRLAGELTLNLIPATTQGDLALGTGEVHVLLLEGCGAREMLTGGYVALLAKRLLAKRGLNRPPPGRRRRSLPLLLPRRRSDEPGIFTYIYDTSVYSQIILS